MMTLATSSTSMGTSFSDNTMAKLVVNLYSSPLTEAHKSLLARGTNFPIIPKYSPKGEYIAAVEEVCLKLPPQSTSRA